MIYHVPQMMKKHGSLRKFSGQGIFINLYEQVHGTRETKNDNLLRYFHRKSNRWDAVTNLLLAEKRLNELRGQEWVKRGYEKKKR